MRKKIRKILFDNFGYGNADKAIEELLSLHIVVHPLHISDFHIGFKYEEMQMDKERYLNKGEIWLRKEYGFNSPRLHKINELLESGKLRHCNDV